jgi:hypothetical protein
MAEIFLSRCGNHYSLLIWQEGTGLHNQGLLRWIPVSWRTATSTLIPKIGI